MFNLMLEWDFNIYAFFFLIVSSAQAKLWISAPNVLQVCCCMFVLLLVLNLHEMGPVLARTDLCFPKFPPGTLLALLVLRHGCWSGSSFMLGSVCVSARSTVAPISSVPEASQCFSVWRIYMESVFDTRHPKSTRQEPLTKTLQWIWPIIKIKHLKPNIKNRKEKLCNYLDDVGMMETQN